MTNFTLFLTWIKPTNLTKAVLIFKKSFFITIAVKAFSIRRGAKSHGIWLLRTEEL